MLEIYHPNHLDPQSIHDIAFRNWSFLASLAVLLYEYSITASDEFRYIWRRPVTPVRLIYVFSRYLGIMSQSANIYLLFGPFSAGGVEDSNCKIWFSSQMVVGCSLIAALDMILFLRVYALHQKNKRVGIFLVLLFCAQICVEVVYAPRTISEVGYDNACNTSRTHPAVLYLSISIWVTHISLAILTGIKYPRLMRLQAPVVKIVARDGAWIAVVICALFAAIVPYSLIRQVAKSYIIFAWPITIISICCCRMIMNLQMLRYAAPGRDPESIVSSTMSSTAELDLDHGLELTTLATQLALQD